MSVQCPIKVLADEGFAEACSLARLRFGSRAWLAMTHNARRRAIYVELAYLDRVSPKAPAARLRQPESVSQFESANSNLGGLSRLAPSFVGSRSRASINAVRMAISLLSVGVSAVVNVIF